MARRTLLNDVFMRLVAPIIMSYTLEHPQTRHINVI